jgi:hypothetical protein
VPGAIRKSFRSKCLHVVDKDNFTLGFIEILVLGVFAVSIFTILSYILVPKPLNTRMFTHKTATLPVSLHGDVTNTLTLRDTLTL